MAFHMVETPRTELGDKTYLSHAADLDFSTINSIPSPSKDNNDLVKNLRQLRGTEIRTPRARAPLGERWNVPSKNEFTPLLKSATKNRMIQFGGSNKENSHLETPAGLKASYRHDSPALPLNSSMLLEEHTASSLAAEGQGTPVPPPMSSSSLMSTPMPALPTRGEGILNDGTNLLTLREQEARLVQIDKENFSLKLKIHFMEEALRRNGKEFNEAAVKENTELKVDKVTLQRDLRQYRKSLAQAEKDLVEYKRQMLDYAEKMKRRHANEGMQEELDQMRRIISDKDSELEKLRIRLRELENEDVQVERMKGDIEDLEAELRDKELIIDDKDEELQRLREEILHVDDNIEDQVRDKNHLSEEKAAAYEQELEERSTMIAKLQQELNQSEVDAEEVKNLQLELQTTKNDLSAELRKRNRSLEEKDREIHVLQVKAGSVEDDTATQQMKDDIDDLHAEIREKDRLIEQRDDELDAVKQSKQQVQDAADKELVTAQDCIRDMEHQQSRALRELQDLRDRTDNSSSRNEALGTAESHIHKLEEQQSNGIETERRLQADLNQLQCDIRSLRQETSRKESEFTNNRDLWESQRRSFELQQYKAEEQIKQLHQTIERTRQNEDTASARETELQEVLEIQKGEVEEIRQALQKADSELSKARKELQLCKNDETTMKEKIENLEDEIEVLQTSLDENDNRDKDDLEAAKQEAEAHKRQVRGLQQDVAKSQTELATLQARHGRLGSRSPSSSPTDLQRTIDNLKDELSLVRKERSDLQIRITQLETTQANTRTDYDTIELNLQASSSQAQLRQKKLSEIQAQLASTVKEKYSLQDDLASASADLESLQASFSDLESSRSEAEKQARDLRVQLQASQREADRKFASQAAAYERDIHNLEQDLEDAQAKAQNLAAAKETADGSIIRLKSKIQGLVADLATARSNRASPRAGNAAATPEERADLHALLKEVKLEAEDLALQLRDRDDRLRTATAHESELRTQLKRVRDERAALADDALRLADAQPLAYFEDGPKQKHQRDPKDKRHAAELRGLARQIEYLRACVKRAESFRADLAFAKGYAVKKVEMHAACTKVDLRLVEAMGVNVPAVLRDEERAQRRDACRRSFKAVAVMVRAAVRMKTAAEGWGKVRERHGVLLRKLDEVRGARTLMSGAGNGRNGMATRGKTKVGPR